jgi:phage tail protein X
MENRYKYTLETTGSNYGKRHYKSTLLPNILPKIGDVYIYAKYTDRLDMLAYRYYGHSRYWWIIAEANKLGKGSLHIKPGLQLRIPSDIADIEVLYHKTQKDR